MRTRIYMVISDAWYKNDIVERIYNYNLYLGKDKRYTYYYPISSLYFIGYL